MKKKYTVNTFIEEFNKKKQEEIDIFLKEVICVSYLPFEKKNEICEKLIQGTSYKTFTDLDGNNMRKIHINTPARYMIYHLNLIDAYTTIAIDMSKCLSEFDLLNNGVYLDAICSYIPEKEIQEIKMLLEMAESDFMQNEYNVSNYIDKKIESLGQRIGFGSELFLKQFGDNLDKLDERKITGILNAVKNFFQK